MSLCKVNGMDQRWNLKSQKPKQKRLVRVRRRSHFDRRWSEVLLQASGCVGANTAGRNIPWFQTYKHLKADWNPGRWLGCLVTCNPSAEILSNQRDPFQINTFSTLKQRGGRQCANICSVLILNIGFAHCFCDAISSLHFGRNAPISPLASTG